MDVTERTEGGHTVLGLQGRLDAVTAADFEARIRQVVGGGATRLVLDLAALEYVSSAGLRALLVTAKLAQAGGGAVTLAQVHGTVRNVLEMSGFTRMFRLTDSVEAALAGPG